MKAASLRSKAIACISALFLVTLSIFGFCVNPAQADDRCSSVLQGQLHNELIETGGVKASEIYKRELYQMSENEAYQEYLNAYSKAGNGSIGAGFKFPIKGVPIGLDFSGSRAKQLSKQEFQKRFNLWKSEISDQINSEKYYDSSNYYREYVRDKNSIDAWEACITKESGGLFAYAYRGPTNGDALLKVSFKPDTRQEAKISFVNPRNLTVSSNSNPLFGSRIYGVTGNTDAGFNIGVNGDIIDSSGRVVGNKEAIAILGPANLPEVEPQPSITKLRVSWDFGNTSSGAIYLNICDEPSFNGGIAGSCAVINVYNSRVHFSGQPSSRGVRIIDDRLLTGTPYRVALVADNLPGKQGRWIASRDIVLFGSDTFDITFDDLQFWRAAP